jgi:methylphosphotriester-DNA--protein-cysteine methyltransferase
MTAAAGVRPDWHFSVMRACQMFVCETATSPLDECAAAVRTLVRCVPRPATPLEATMLRLTLQDVLWRWSETIHRRYHRPGATCGTTARTVLADSPETQAAACRQFERRATALLRALRAAHPECAADDARRILLCRDAGRLALTSLTDRLGVRPEKLRRDFRARFGMSLREFHTRARVARALPLLRNGGIKIDAAARDAGFRSRRNFYAALATHTGLQPSAIRKLPLDRVDALIVELTAARR